MDASLSQVDLMARLLDVASLRHEVIAQNVANVNTPGYQRLEVTFDRALERALARGEASALGRLKPRVTPITDGPARADGNNVDINREMAQLDRNTLVYRTFAQILALRLSTLRTAVTGR